MKIGLGCDHGWYNLKLEIIEFLKSKNIEYLDFGTNNGQDLLIIQYMVKKLQMQLFQMK